MNDVGCFPERVQKNLTGRENTAPSGVKLTFCLVSFLMNYFEKEKEVCTEGIREQGTIQEHKHSPVTSNRSMICDNSTNSY